jgi:hypothetical protein
MTLPKFGSYTLRIVDLDHLPPGIGGELAKANGVGKPVKVDPRMFDAVRLTSYPYLRALPLTTNHQPPTTNPLMNDYQWIIAQDDTSDDNLYTIEVNSLVPLDQGWSYKKAHGEERIILEERAQFKKFQITRVPDVPHDLHIY